jgi:hypothetical protein
LIIPNNDTIRIRVGTKQLKFLDISVDVEENAGCIARASYAALGHLDTKEATYMSTRQLNIQGFRVPPPRYFNYGGDGGDGGGGGGNPAPSGPSHSMGLETDVTGQHSVSHSHSEDSESNSDNSSGATWICTATYGTGLISNSHYRLLRKYGIGLRKTDPYLMIAYDWFGPKIAEFLGNKYTGIFLTNYYKAKQKKYKLTLSQHAFDVVSKFILRPMWRLLGKILTMKKGN